MKKHIKLLVILGILLVGSFSFYLFKKYALVYVNNKIMPSSSGIAMMLETSAGSGNYEMTTQSEWPTEGYVFNANLSKCENGSKLSWDNENKRVLMNGNKSDKCYVYFDIYVKLRFDQSCNDNTLACHTAKLYTGTQGVNNIYYHDENLINGAEDNSYRFAGANPNNYVCFGDDDATCPSDDLYRIIGVIDGKVKLIHANGATTDMLGTNGEYAKTYGSTSNYKGNGDLTKIGRYKWNKTGDNTWSTSITNTVNLNKNFLTYLDSKNTKWKNMIADTTWYVGGMTYNDGSKSIAKTAYNYEVGANKDTSTTAISKIGLMYVSDYGFAAAPSAWTTILYNYDDATIKSKNWLYIGLYEWTLSRNSDVSGNAFGVYDGGYVSGDDVGNSIGYAVRPSFNLSSSIKFISGEGTAVNPIRINL